MSEFKSIIRWIRIKYKASVTNAIPLMPLSRKVHRGQLLYIDWLQKNSNKLGINFAKLLYKSKLQQFRNATQESRKV